MYLTTIIGFSLASFAGVFAAEHTDLDVQYNQPDYTKQGAIEYYHHEVTYQSNPYQLNQFIQNQDDSIVILDLRNAQAFAKGHVPGAINFPPEKWSELNELPRDKTLIVYCYDITCFLAKNAAIRFLKEGFEVKEMFGGWQTWVDQGYPVEL